MTIQISDRFNFGKSQALAVPLAKLFVGYDGATI